MKFVVLGEKIRIDLDKLIDNRALIQANSGGGKSYAIRKLLEETHGSVQQIVLDIEGEFQTLREKYDYLLIGKNGDIPTSIKTAEILAHKLLELGTDAIIDLYELKHHERITFVQRFCDAMVNAPKELWHPVMIVIDEAHLFCKEKEKCESTSSVIDLGTRGRKRGYCLVAATQRLAKLNKDLAAELGNKFIGRTGLDIDMKRAAEELGFTSKEKILSLRNLEPGEFYTFGPAISKEVFKSKIGTVKTSHPKSGSRMLTKLPPPPQEKIRAVLAKLKQLPIEAEQEIKTRNDMLAEIRRLKTELRQKSGLQRPVADKATLAKERALGQQEGARKASQEADQQLKSIQLAAKQQQAGFGRLQGVLKQISHLAAKAAGEPIPQIKIQPVKSMGIPLRPPKPGILPMRREVAYLPEQKSHTTPFNTENFEETEKLSPAFKRLLQSCAMVYPNSITRRKMAFLAEVPILASTFRNGISSLKTRGLIIPKGNDFAATEEGVQAAGDFEQMSSDPDEVIKMWKSRLSPAYQRMLTVVIEAYPNELTKQEFSEASGVPLETSTFRNGLSKLKSLGLIKSASGIVKAADELFE